MDCEVGHIPPAWTPAAIVAESPTVDRCVTLQDLPPHPLEPSRGWYVCGGLHAHEGMTYTVPAVCPSAPGGLHVGLGWRPTWEYRAPDPGGAAAVVLDCPGRYAASRQDPRGPVSITLAEPGPEACKAKRDAEVLAGAWGFGADGLALHYPAASLPGLVETVDAEALRGAWAADLDSWGTSPGTSEWAARLVWKGGRTALGVGALRVLAGRDSDWNDVHAVGEAGPSGSYVDLSDLAIRVRVPRAVARLIPRGDVVLDTYANVRLQAPGDDVLDALPVRLPAAKVCNVSLPAGQTARLSAASAPDSGRPLCKRTPPDPPHDLTIGAGWAELGWDHLMRPYNDHDPKPEDGLDMGCVVRCGKP